MPRLTPTDSHRANGNGAVSQTFCQSGRDEAAWSNSMTRSARIAVAVALLLGGTSLATAKSRGAAGAHGKPFHLGINETTPRPTVADLLLPKTRFVRTGDAIRPRLHVQQCLRSSQSGVCLVHLSPAKHEDATHYNRWRIFPGSVAGALLSGEAALNPTPHVLLVVKVCRSGYAQLCIGADGRIDLLRRFFCVYLSINSENRSATQRRASIRRSS
jgi:hypothetical protein